jgi:hypothetical protein
MSSRKSASKGGPRESLVAAGIVLFAVICCGGLLLAGTLGIGAALSALFSPWILVPTLLVVVGIFASYLKR